MWLSTLFGGRRVRHRPHGRGRVERRAEPNGLGRVDQLFDEPVVHRALHKDALGRVADLPRIGERTGADHSGGTIEVAVLEDDRRPVAAELEQHGLSCRQFRDGQSRARRTREPDGDDAVMAGDRRAHVGRRPQHQVQRSFRHACIEIGLHQVARGERRPFRRLPHHGIAGREPRREVFARDSQRKIPRRDDAVDPTRLPHRHDPAARIDRLIGLALEPGRALGGVAMHQDRGVDLAQGFAVIDLALFERDVAGELLAPRRDHVGHLVAECGALERRHLREHWQRSFRLQHGGIDVGGSPLLHFGDQLARRRARQCQWRATRAPPPFAADQQLDAPRLHVFVHSSGPSDKAAGELDGAAQRQRHDLIA